MRGESDFSNLCHMAIIVISKKWYSACEISLKVVHASLLWEVFCNINQVFVFMCYSRERIDALRKSFVWIQ